MDEKLLDDISSLTSETANFLSSIRAELNSLELALRNMAKDGSPCDEHYKMMSSMDGIMDGMRALTICASVIHSAHNQVHNH